MSATTQASKVALVMAPGYSPEQAEWICRTARRNPGVPVVFEGRDGRQQVVRVDGGWEISGA